MTNGPRCWKAKVRVLAALAALVLSVAGGWWWLNVPRTPEELFQARCSTCHALPNLCVYRPENRPAIVMTMRRERGAAEVVSNAEAKLIIAYITDELICL